MSTNRISGRTPNRIRNGYPQGISKTESHERTNARTDVEVGCGSILPQGRTRRGAAGFGCVRVRLMPHAASRGGQFANDHIDYARRTDLGKKPKETTA